MNLVNLKMWIEVGHEDIKILNQYAAKLSNAPIDNYYIGLIPELNVYGYGKSRKEAIEDMEFAAKAILRFLRMHPEYATDNEPQQVEAKTAHR